MGPEQSSAVIDHHHSEEEAMLQRKFDSCNFLKSPKLIIQVAVCVFLTQQIWSHFLEDLY